MLATRKEQKSDIKATKMVHLLTLRRWLDLNFLNSRSVSLRAEFVRVKALIMWVAWVCSRRVPDDGRALVDLL